MMVKAAESGNALPNSSTQIVLVKRTRKDVKGLYKILRVPTNASHEKIIKAAKRELMKAHPDHGGASKEFQRVYEAYRVLSDEGQRAAYDSMQIPEKTISLTYCETKEEYNTPIWYKDAAEILGEEDKERALEWLDMLVKAASDFHYFKPIRAGVCNGIGQTFYTSNNIFILGNIKPYIYMADILILREKINNYAFD